MNLIESLIVKEPISSYTPPCRSYIEVFVVNGKRLARVQNNTPRLKTGTGNEVTVVETSHEQGKIVKTPFWKKFF